MKISGDGITKKQVYKEMKVGGANNNQVIGKKFNAMAQGRCDFSVEVIPSRTEEYGLMMCICYESAIYITKQQAADFFGFDNTEIGMSTPKKLVKALDEDIRL